MCQSLPRQIIALHDREATIKVANQEQRVNVAFITEPLQVGDYLLVHAGLATAKVNAEEAKAIMELISGTL